MKQMTEITTALNQPFDNTTNDVAVLKKTVGKHYKQRAHPDSIRYSFI